MPLQLTHPLAIRYIQPGIIRIQQLFDWFFCVSSPNLSMYGCPKTGYSYVVYTKRIPQVVLSAGVGDDVSFELALSRHAKKIVMVDPSPTGVNTISQLRLSSNCIFLPIGVAGKTGTAQFTKPLNMKEGSFRKSASTTTKIHSVTKSSQSTVETTFSHSFDVLTVKDICEKTHISRIDLLKLDIEGFEYEVLDSMICSKIYPSQIVVEFHHFLPGFCLADTINTIHLLYKNGYVLFHKNFYDYTFVRVADFCVDLTY
jgi:FkbM family methyltransferase